MISYRGVSIWPSMQPETYVGDHLRLRFMAKKPFTFDEALCLLKKAHELGFEITAHHMLYLYDNQYGSSLSQEDQ